MSILVLSSGTATGREVASRAILCQREAAADFGPGRLLAVSGGGAASTPELRGPLRIPLLWWHCHFSHKHCCSPGGTTHEWNNRMLSKQQQVLNCKEERLEARIGRSISPCCHSAAAPPWHRAQTQYRLPPADWPHPSNLTAPASCHSQATCPSSYHSEDSPSEDSEMAGAGASL